MSKKSKELINFEVIKPHLTTPPVPTSVFAQLKMCTDNIDQKEVDDYITNRGLIYAQLEATCHLGLIKYGPNSPEFDSQVFAILTACISKISSTLDTLSKTIIDNELQVYLHLIDKNKKELGV